MAKPVNIGVNQRKTRAIMGISLLIFAFLLAYLKSANFLNLIVFFTLAFNGVLLVLEARNGVCPVNAYRNKQSMSGYFSLGQEDIKDKKLAKKFREIGKRESIQSVVAALLLSFLFALI